jgi:putative SOS response-associated peptidase YedK
MKKKFTMITMNSCDKIKTIHHRQPLIIDPSFVNDWINNSIELPKLMNKMYSMYADFDYLKIVKI